MTYYKSSHNCKINLIILRVSTILALFHTTADRESFMKWPLMCADAPFKCVQTRYYRGFMH
jgi:hypothetical protein